MYLCLKYNLLFNHITLCWYNCSNMFLFIFIIRDTAGTEKYQSLIQLYYRGAIGLFIVYDVTDLNSLHNLEFWMKNIDDVSIQHFTLTAFNNSI